MSAKSMGSELSKRYDVDKDATGSGGHGYQWKSYQATRKKGGLEVSVFVFEKAALWKNNCETRRASSRRS